MRRTRKLRTAYDKSMDTMMLMLLLFLMNNDPEMKGKMQAFLSFYRANREMIAAFAQNGIPMSAPKPECDEKNRPREEVGVNKILEEYLSRLG